MNMHTSRIKPASIPPTDVARELLEIRNNIQRELQRVDILLAMLGASGAPAVGAGCQEDTLAGRRPNSGETSESEDLLYGVPAIAAFLKLTPAKVYHLAGKGDTPTFKIGAKVCARRSSLSAWLANLEAAAAHAEG